MLLSTRVLEYDREQLDGTDLSIPINASRGSLSRGSGTADEDERQKIRIYSEFERPSVTRTTLFPILDRCQQSDFEMEVQCYWNRNYIHGILSTATMTGEEEITPHKHPQPLVSRKIAPERAIKGTHPPTSHSLPPPYLQS